MNEKTTAVSAKLSERQGEALQPVEIELKLREWYKVQGRKLVSLLGSQDKASKLIATAVWVINRSPELVECTFDSLTNCLLQSATLNLFPGPLQECVYVALYNGQRKCKEANFWSMYPGKVKLMYNGGFVTKIQSAVVWESDYFDYKRGSNEQIIHQPCEDEKERGARKGVYCIIKNRFGQEHIAYLTAEHVERTKNRSRASKSDFSPWNSKYPEDIDWMWKKTALNQGSKLIPKSPEMAMLEEFDNTVDVIEPAKAQVFNFDADRIVGATARPTAAIAGPSASMDITGTGDDELPVGKTIENQSPEQLNLK